MSQKTTEKKTALVIHMRDMRRVGFCPAGVEMFFMRQGWDYADFLVNGISSTQLLASGSVFARKCVSAAEQAREGE